MGDKHNIWLNNFLIPYIINKEKSKLEKCDSANDVHFKYAKIQQGNSNVTLFTICNIIEIVLDVDGEEKTIAVFTKVTPNLKEDLCNTVNLDAKFINETLAYEKIIPALEPSVHIPTFYYSHTKKMDAAIAISDFSAEGFSMSDSLVNLSLDHILATMTAIGNFHGASYAMKHNDPARFDALRSQLVNTRAKNKGQLQATLRETSRRASNQIRKNVNDSDMVTESFLSDFERLFGENAFCFLDAKLKAKEPLAVICHGDFLRNNIAYRYDERGLATEAMIFDLQTMCYGSPMLDVCTFMAMSTGYKVRQNHFDEIFQAYYNAVIDQYLRKTNLKDVPDHMSYSAFLKEYTLYLPFGYHITTFFLAHMYYPIENHLEDIKNGIIVFHSPKHSGDDVDREIRAQIIEMCNLYQRFQLKLLDYQ